MAQTKAGAQLICANRLGITVIEYRTLLGCGFKWCTGCKCWHREDKFGNDRSRSDGRDTKCFVSRKRIYKNSYKPRPRPPRGRMFVAPRDGDKKQARRRVNFLVESGLLTHPNKKPCTDCGHKWSENERRHEYDHHLGYDVANHEQVQAVCTTCHHKRSEQEGNNTRGQSNGQAKLTATQVLEIRALCSGGVTYKEIAAKYCVNPQSVSNIINRKKWKHI